MPLIFACTIRTGWRRCLLHFHRAATRHARLAPVGGAARRAPDAHRHGDAGHVRLRDTTLEVGEGGESRALSGTERSRGPRSSLQSEPVSRRGLAECLLGNGTRNHVLCKLTPSRRRVLRINWRKSRFRITVTIARPETGQLAGHPCPTAGPRCSSRWRAFLSPVHNFTDPRCCRKATAPSRVRGRVSCNSRD